MDMKQCLGEIDVLLRGYMGVKQQFQFASDTSNTVDVTLDTPDIPEEGFNLTIDLAKFKEHFSKNK